MTEQETKEILELIKTNAKSCDELHRLCKLLFKHIQLIEKELEKSSKGWWPF